MRFLKPSFALVWPCLYVFMFCGCRPHEIRRAIPFADLEKGPSFVATVDRLDFEDIPDNHGNPQDTCIIGIVTENGRKLCIGSFDSEASLTGPFARTLQIGDSYKFPKVWLDYKVKIKQKEIAH